MRFGWPRGDVIAFSCVFRQRDHQKRVISSPWRCFHPSRAAIFSLTNSANRNDFSVRRVPCAEDEVGSHSVFVTKSSDLFCDRRGTQGTLKELLVCRVNTTKDQKSDLTAALSCVSCNQSPLTLGVIQTAHTLPMLPNLLAHRSMNPTSDAVESAMTKI